MYVGLHVKYPLSLLDFKGTLSPQIFENKLKYQISSKPSSGSRVVTCGRTELTKLLVTFCNFKNVPKDADMQKNKKTVNYTYIWTIFLFRIIEYLVFFIVRCKTKARTLNLSFEIGFCFCFHVKHGGWERLRGENLISRVPLSELISNTGLISNILFEISSLKGTRLIRFITPQPPSPFFT